MLNSSQYPQVALISQNQEMGFQREPVFETNKKTPSLTLKKKVNNQLYLNFLANTEKLFTPEKYSYEFLYEDSQKEDGLNYKAQQCLDYIDDPLWKEVCAEVLRMMPPFIVLKIWNGRLGDLSSQNTSISLYCSAEEMANLAKAYDFVILASLQKYFPALKQIRVEVDSAPPKA